MYIRRVITHSDENPPTSKRPWMSSIIFSADGTYFKSAIPSASKSLGLAWMYFYSENINNSLSSGTILFKHMSSKSIQ